MLGVEKTVIERVEYDEQAGQLVAHARPARGHKNLCGQCGRRSAKYDQGGGRRRWRTLDLGTVKVELEADAPRVRCAEHGVTVAAVPWARHGARHTRYFDDTVAWLVVRCSKSAVSELLRIAWRTVGVILTRVSDDALAAAGDRFGGLRRIGIDEVSYKRGHRYLTIVVDHDTGRLIWAAPGKDSATVRLFFDLLGPERCALLTHISADAAWWIALAIDERCPNATQCLDPFHVVAWATDALDQVRREAWNDARRKPGASYRDVRGYENAKGDALALKHSRYALWKNPEDLTDRQRDKLAWIAKTDPRLHRAYLLKEALRYVFKVKGDEGKYALQRWLSWASRSRIPGFVRLAQRLRAYLPKLHATLDNGISNAILESTNTKIRLLTRVAYGFHSPEPLIALAMLSLAGYCPPLPGRR